MTNMTREQAESLAAWNDDYRAKRCRDGSWGVWSDAAEHWVEFDVIPSRDANFGPRGWVG